MKTGIVMRTIGSVLHVLALVVLLVVEMLWETIRDIAFHGHRHALGGDRWLSAWERLVYFFPTNKGIILGRHVRVSARRSFQGTVVVAPVGMGKTTSLVIPNVLECEGSIVVTDPSGEVFERTAGYLAERGFRLQVLNTSDISRSHSFNPVARVTNAKESKQLAELLVTAANPDSGGDQAFWESGAKIAIDLVIRLLLTQEPIYRNLYNVAHLLGSFGATGDGLDELFVRHADERLFAEYKGFITQTDKVLQSMISTAKTALEKFSDPDLCKLCSGDGEALDLGSLRKEPTAIFIQSREDKIAYYSFIYRCLYTELFEQLMNMPGKTDLPVTMLMDEFANIGRIPNFSGFATTIRKRRVAVMIVLQEMSQLEAVYGKNAADTILFGGMAGKVFFPGLGHETSTRVSQMLGVAPARYKEDGHRQVRERALRTPTEVRTLQDNEAIYLFANKRPLLLHLLPFYKSRRMRRMSDKAMPNVGADLRQVQLHYLPIPVKGSTGNPVPPEIDIDL